jgi:hypothetical protein
MSHLLYLNSRDNYPNKCPHICLHLTVKQHPTARGRVSLQGIALTEEAHYTDRTSPCKGFYRNISRSLECALRPLNYRPELALRAAILYDKNGFPTAADCQARRRLRHFMNCDSGPEAA